MSYAYTEDLEGNKIYDSRTITPESLTPEKPIKFEPPEPDNTNYQGIINAGSALSKSLTPKPIVPTATNPLENMLAGLEAPPSGAAAYEGVYGAGPTQQEVSALETNKINAQKEFDLTQAEIASLNAEAKAAPISVQEESVGRGRTRFATNILTTDRLRDIALRSLPLEGKLLSAQAVLTNNTNLLNTAKEKFDKVFLLRQQDIQNQYNYKLEQQNRIFNYLTKKEQDKLDEIRRQDDRTYQESRDNLNLAQNLSKDAMNVGLADVASQLTQLNPNSPTFQRDLANLQAQIVNKQTQNQTQATQDELARAGYTYVSTPAERDRLKSQGYDILVQSGRTYAKPPEPVKITGGGGINYNKPLSISDAKALGVPYGTTAIEAMNMGIIPADISTKPPTAGQQTTAGYAVRAEEASSQIQRLENKISGMNYLNFKLQSKLPSAFQSDYFQSYDQSARNFINAVLRPESGAAIAESEFDNAYKQYIPQAGDAPETIRQKAQNRQLKIESLKQASGSAFTPAETLLQTGGKGGAEEEIYVLPDGTEYVKGEDGLYYPK